MQFNRKYVFMAVGAVSGILLLYLLTRKRNQNTGDDEWIPKGLAGLEPETRKKVEKFFDLAKKSGKPLVLVSARRGCKKQDTLYAQGRSTPGKIITNARCGESDHNLGLAVDVAPIVNGKINYKVPRSHWEELSKIAESVGLHWGGRWKTLDDLVHFSSGRR